MFSIHYSFLEYIKRKNTLLYRIVFTIASSVSPIIAIFVFFILLKGDVSNLGDVGKLLLAIVVAFAADRVLFLMRELYEDYVKEVQYERTLSSLGQLETEVKLSSSVQYVGTPDISVKILENEIGAASIVKNTFVNIGGISNPRSSYNEKIRRIYETALSGEGTRVWKDIVSVNELFDPRYTSISPKGKSAKLHIGVLKHNIPIINFTICEYQNQNRTDVYFGWLYSNPSRSIRIYRTSEPKIVSMFNDYFDILWNQKLVDDFYLDFGKTGRARFVDSDVVDKVGVWFTMAYAPNGELKNTALLRIKFRDAKARIEGIVSNPDMTEIEQISHKDPVQSGERLYFDYSIRGINSWREGFCMYEIGRYLGEDTLTGFYFDHKEGNKKISIIGRRIRDDDQLVEAAPGTSNPDASERHSVRIDNTQAKKDHIEKIKSDDMRRSRLFEREDLNVFDIENLRKAYDTYHKEIGDVFNSMRYGARETMEES